jgi:hypothetical protein
MAGCHTWSSEHGAARQGVEADEAKRIGASQLIWNDRCQARGGYVVDVPPWRSESTVKAGRFDDESF